MAWPRTDPLLGALPRAITRGAPALARPWEAALSPRIVVAVAAILESAAIGTLAATLSMAGTAEGDVWEFSLDDDAGGLVELES